MSQLDPQQTTVQDICLAALKECGQVGVGQTALAEDITDAWARLQWMLQQWQNKRWLVYHLVDYAIVATGAISYSFGPGGQINTSSMPSYGLQAVGLGFGGAGFAVGDTVNLQPGTPLPASLLTPPQIKVTTVAAGVITGFVLVNPGQLTSPLPNSFTQAATSGAGVGSTWNLPVWMFLPTRVTSASTISQRPDKLDSAFLRQIQNSQPNQVDYPLGILESREDYNRIRLKSLSSFPGAVFMDSGWPLSQVYAYPVPQASIYELHLTIKEQLPCKFAALGTVLNLPMEYYDAMLFNLALRLRSRYQTPSYPGDQLPGLAKDSLEVLRGSNTQIAELVIDPAITRSGIYNIFSDTIY